MPFELQTYLGNEHGLLLGPYDADEIGAQIRAKKTLTQGGESEVWVIRASSYAIAQHHLERARREYRLAQQASLL